MPQIIQLDTQWQITGAMTMGEVEALLIESEALQQNALQSIDLAQVTDVDTAAISLMLEWIRRASARESEVVFKNIPDSLLSLINLYEVSTLITYTKS